MERFARHVPAGLVALAIFAVTITPGKTMDSLGVTNEIYYINGHFFMFSLLCLVLFKSTKNLSISFLFSALYGISMEFLQKIIPGRSFQYLDIVVNSFGAFLALVILWKRLLILPKRLNSWLEK